MIKKLFLKFICLFVIIFQIGSYFCNSCYYNECKDLYSYEIKPSDNGKYMLIINKKSDISKEDFLSHEIMKKVNILMVGKCNAISDYNSFKVFLFIKSLLNYYHIEKLDLLDLGELDALEIPQGNLAFDFCKFKIKKLILPEKLKKIGVKAFLGQNEMTIDKLPNSLEYIEFGAFIGCSSLNLAIPNSVKCSFDCGLGFGGFDKRQNVKFEKLNNNSFCDCSNCKIF